MTRPTDSGNPLLKTSLPAPWHQQIASVLTKQVRLKAIGTPVFIALFFGAYFYVLKNPAYPTTVMPFTWLDGLIGFQPQAMALYVSLWVYVSLPPALLKTPRELYAYGLAIAGTCLVGLMVFYFWPTAVPLPDIDWHLHPELAFMKNIDSTGNAFPSLHVATAFFSGIWLHHLLRQFGAPHWSLVLNWAWCIGILYSTLATRQHVAMDVLAGIALGGITAWLSVRRHAATQPIFLHTSSS